MIIGFIGLGNMGFPIASNLIQSGFKLKVYNRTIDKANPLIKLGATICQKAEEAAKEIDVLITMLSDDGAVKEIAEKTVPFLRSGALHISMSTISPSTVDEVLPLHTRHHVKYVAAPVMGRPPAAASRTLYILLSGDENAKKIADPVLKSISQRIFDFGDAPTTAHDVKLTLNMMVFTVLELLSEVFLFAEKRKINKSALMETINNTMFAAPVFKTYGSLLLAEQPVQNGFALHLANKDIRLLQSTASKAGIQLPLADLIRQHFEESIASGLGNNDISSLLGHLRDKLNLAAP